jgi:sulfate adenylyltransferase
MSPVPIPQHCPAPRELDDLELLVHGAFGVDGFEGAGGLVTLEVPGGVADNAVQAGALELVDPEGLPLARVEVASTYESGELVGVTGTVVALAHHEFGAFRRLYLSPDQVRERYDASALAVPVTGPLTVDDLARIREHARGPVVLLALAGAGAPQGCPRPR